MVKDFLLYFLLLAPVVALINAVVELWKTRRSLRELERRMRHGL